MNPAMYPNPYAPQPGSRRSPIPKVIGILLIVFGSLGLLGGLIGLVGDNDMKHLLEGDRLKTFTTITTVFTVIGLGVSFLQLMTGMSCVRYKSGAPGLAVIYGIITMVFQLANIVVVFTYLKPMLDGIPGAGAMFGIILIFTTIITMAWPIVVLALMTRPAAKAACTW
jgi:hypothetical protein